jgi:tetratricopeptide (TPR) repeat protein
MKRSLAALLAASTSLALPLRHARADDPPAAPDASTTQADNPRQAAAKHFVRGKALQDAGSYDEAIAEYEQGYALVNTPGVFYSIAQCYRLAGNKRRAVEYYRRYLDALPDGEGAPAAREYIVTLTREIDAEPKPEPPPAPVVTPPAPAPIVAPEPAEPAAPPYGAWQWSGIALGLSGLVAAGFGTYYQLHAYRLDNEISQETRPETTGESPLPMSMWTKELTDKYYEGVRDQKIALGLFIGAGALVLGGAAAWWYGPRPEVDAGARAKASARASRLRLLPTTAPGAVGFVLGGTF